MTSILKMEGISKTYDNQPVLNQLDFELQSGQVMGLLGRNGAGKSTLMKIALGFVKPDTGRSIVLGESSELLSNKAKDHIGFVPQQPIGFDAITIKQAFEFIGRSYSCWDDNYAAELCKLFELSDTKKIGTLSEGQKQLVAIVLALAHKPKCLILDEPISALDPLNRREFLSEVINHAVDNESTILFSTHIMSDIERIASHISFLGSGKIALSGELDAIKDSVYRIPCSVQVSDDFRCIYAGEDYNIVQSVTAQEKPEQGLALNLDDLFVALNSSGKHHG